MYLPLDLPPGMYREGTEFQSRGRWINGNLIRFYDGTIRPVGGWSPVTDTTLNGKGRAVVTWRDNSQLVWTAIGTDQKLYVIPGGSGYLYDITPAGYGPGPVDAFIAPGYGAASYGNGNYGKDSATASGVASNYSSGTYGSGPFNETTSQSTTVQPAAVWSLDNWGEDLVGCTRQDGKIYQWLPSSTNNPGAVLANAPVANAIIVTDQRILMALGAGGVPRRVSWSDQGDNTTWTPDATNQAGSYDLSTAGRLTQAKKFRGQVLLLTDIDAHLASYTADAFVYGFQQVGGDGCGAISPNCMAELGDLVAWMAPGAFYIYNGYVDKLPCGVSDFVFSNLNTTQASKISCFINSGFSEVTWFYVSSAATEIDSYVTWNYRENHWVTGSLTRTGGADRGPLPYPLLVGADGYVYQHEVGFNYSGAVPYLESGPYELGQGDAVLYARQLVPDEKTEGDVQITFKAKFYPNGPETSFGPYTLTEPTDVRFCARQVRLRYDAVNADDWRVGSPRLEVVAGGTR